MRWAGRLAAVAVLSKGRQGRTALVGAGGGRQRPPLAAGKHPGPASRKPAKLGHLTPKEPHGEHLASSRPDRAKNGGSVAAMAGHCCVPDPLLRPAAQAGAAAKARRAASIVC
jgi:hypothetical protein